MRRYPVLRAIDAAVVRNSLRVMILLRLNPLIPFGVLNYLFGISGVSGVSFVLGVVGVVPWHLWLICLGASANSLVYDVGGEENSVGRIVLLGIGTAFGVIGLVIMWNFVKKELQKVRLCRCFCGAIFAHVLMVVCKANPSHRIHLMHLFPL